MYYEEQVIDGQLCYRTTPDGPWAVVPYKELVGRVVRAERKVNTFDQVREALQTLYDEQNDAPLENRRVQWGYAMTLARDALAAMEEQP